MARRVVRLAALVALARAAQDYARRNPETVSAALDRVEAVVSRKAGPAVRKGLGLPPGGPTGPR